MDVFSYLLNFSSKARISACQGHVFCLLTCLIFLYDGLYKQKRINAYKPSHKTASDYPFFHEIVLNKYMLFCLNWQAFLINYSKAFINIHFNVIAVNHLRWILYICVTVYSKIQTKSRKYVQSLQNIFSVQISRNYGTKRTGRRKPIVFRAAKKHPMRNTEMPER